MSAGFGGAENSMNKTEMALEKLKNSPMKYKQFALLIGAGQAIKLINRGCVEKYWDENPEYHIDGKWKRPMAFFVRLGKTRYEANQTTPKEPSPSAEEIRRAITLLERAGYKVAPPNASFSRRP